MQKNILDSLIIGQCKLYLFLRVSVAKQSTCKKAFRHYSKSISMLLREKLIKKIDFECEERFNEFLLIFKTVFKTYYLKIVFFIRKLSSLKQYKTC